MRVRDVPITHNKRGQVATMVVFVNGGKNRWRRRYVRVLEQCKDGSELFAWCIQSIEAAMNDKLPDALLRASAVRTGRMTLRCIRNASKPRRSRA